MTPTDEQQAALELFMTGDSMVIEAGAGTGKTSTLKLLAASTRARGRYIAFNRAIVADVADKLPERCSASTAHSLAMRAVGRRYAHRLNASRQKSSAIARALGIRPVTVRYGVETKNLSDSYLAGLVMRSVTRFCQTAEDKPGRHHVPYIDGIDPPDEDGKRTWVNNAEVRAALEPFIHKAWADLQRTDGQLRFGHEHYLKMWQLEHPTITTDYILFDEAQDANPVMAAVIAEQTHAQRVYVGDSAQAIYEFTGAVNALAEIATDHRRFLTQSFRFGQEIADVANETLAQLDADLRLRGNPERTSSVGDLGDEDPDAILTRTNAKAVTTILECARRGVVASIVGGGAEVVRFANAADELRTVGWTAHPELTCFTSWGQVQEYCLAPETRILTADLEWRSIDALSLGDRIVGFDEEAGPGTAGRRYATAAVESTKRIVRPCWRITTDDGTSVIASVEHRWLVKSGSSLRWCRTDHLRPGSEIASLGATWEPDDSRDAGWLAGMFDGEGWLVRPKDKGTAVIGVSQNEGPTLERLRWVLKSRGFTFSDRAYTRNHRLTLTGGLAEKLRFLGTIQPHRLVARAAEAWEGNRVEARRRARVRLIEDIGDQEVVALGTTTRTLVAEGMLSHNCAQDPQGGELKLLVDLIDDFGSDTIRRALDNMPTEADADIVISTAHKAKGREWGVVRIADDFADIDESDQELRLRYVAITRARDHIDESALHVKVDPEQAKLAV